jgi:hypothetical protein
MAKKTIVKKFQNLIKHTPKIEKVRSDIKIHCNTENNLAHLMKEFAIDSSTFDDIFAEQTKLKRSLFKKKQVTGKDAIRLTVATYLNYLIQQAKIKEFQNTLDERIAKQEELKQALKADPECYNMVIDVEKQMSPDQAIEKMRFLKKDAQKIYDEMKKVSDEIIEKIQSYVDDKNEIMNELAETLESQWRKVNEHELDELLKALSQFSE